MVIYEPSWAIYSYICLKSLLYDEVLKTKPSTKNTLRLENFIASLIYSIANGLLALLDYLLGNLRGLDNARTILLFRTGGLGDMVCAIPTFKALRKYFSSSKLILLTNHEPIFDEPQSLTSLVGNNIFDEIIYYCKEDLRSFSKICSLINRLRKHKINKLFYLSQYDVTFRRLLRDMLFFYFSGCKKLYGFRLNKHFKFKIAQRYGRRFDTETERLFSLLRPLEISKITSDFALSITKEDRQVIDNLWPKHKGLNGQYLVAINPGAKFSVNHWPKENFLKLSRALIDKYNAFIVLIGREDKEGVLRFIESDLKNNCLNLCNKTNFMQTLEVLLRCDLLISCDSGPLHLAAILHKPVVGIYTARDYPNCWYPGGSQHIILRHDVACQICLKTSCQTMECINGISVEEVILASWEILSRK